MTKSKIVRLLSSFSSAEGKTVKDWLKEQPRWRNSPTTKLLEHLLTGIRKNDATLLSKQVVFKRCYPDRPYSEGYLHKQSHRLYNHLKTWLIQQSIVALDSNDLFFLRALQERGLHHDFQVLSKQMEEELNGRQRRDERYFEDCRLFYQEKDHFFGQQQERRYDDALQKKSESLDRYFILKKLKLACEMDNRNRIIQADYQAMLLPEVIRLIESEPGYQQEPAIAIYWHVWKCLQAQSSITDFERLTALLSTHPKVFSPVELREIYRYAQNFCIRKINTGDASFKDRLLMLYQYQLKQGLFLIDGNFPANDFKNIVTLGLSVGAYEWVEKFMDRYHDHLSQQQHDNVYNYNLAQFFFATKAYNQAIQLLRSVKFTDRYYDINSSIILLKTYLALEDYDSLHYFLDAYKIRMQRNREVASSYRKSIVNFLRLCKSLARIKERRPYSKPDEHLTNLTKLREQIESTQVLFDRKWLLDSTHNP